MENMKLSIIIAQTRTMWDSLLENISTPLSETPYYLGLWSGILITVVIFVPVFNKILTHLTFGEELSTHGIVPNPPELTKKQKDDLKDALLWWNKQCDSWYITKLSSVDKALIGEKINLLDIQRIGDATQVGKTFARYKQPKETQEIFDEFKKSLSKIECKLKKEIDYRRLNHKITKEIDTLSKQLKIAKYSAVAAIASAIATGLLAYYALVQ